MACDGFLPEQYGLYSLGTLEEGEASEISAHLQQNCETCLREVRQHITFWTVYAEAATPLVPAPRKRDWTAILGQQSSSKPRINRTWQQWSAMAAAIALVSGLSVAIAVVYSRSEQKQTNAELFRARRQITEVTRQRDAATAALNQIPLPALPPSSTTAPPRPAPSANRQEEQLRQLLNTSQQQLTAARQSLDASQAQLRTTQTELNRQQQELASLRSSTAQLQARLSATEASQNENVVRVQSLQNRVRELEQDRQRLQEAVAREQRRSVQSTLAISYLELPGTRLIPLSGTESAAGAHGYVLITRDNQLLFSETGLPTLPAGRTYQLWLLRSRGEPVVSGGLFTGAGGARNQITSNARGLIAGLNAVAVTDEPAGGSRLPTGRKVLLGTLRS